MKVLLVSLNFAPELTGIGKYSGEMADGLIERGHEVAVVCAPPYYPSWKVEPGYKAGAYRTEHPKPGLTVHRCPIWIPKRLGGLSRLLHLASFALSSLPVLLWLVLWQPRMVFVVAPALFCAPGAWLTARLAGAKAWLHIQDFEIDAAFELGLLRQPLLRRGAQFIERRLLRRFDAVSTISRRMLRRLASKGVVLQRTEVLPNWVDLSLVKPGGHSLEFRQSLGIDASQTVCLFSGTMNRKQGLGVVVAAARALQSDANLVFVLCGNGEMRPELEAQTAGMNNVRLLDLQPAARLNALLNMADMHLLPQLRGAADLVMPSKLIGMLASGRPVVASSAPGTEIASIVVGCGVVVDPECPDSLVQAISDLARDPERRQRLGASARDYAERVLDARTILDRLNERLHTLVEVPLPDVPITVALDATPLPSPQLAEPLP
jgi:colanic acid biosynthesis glycosyl transferase WcaI